ncbi:MAG: ABC transporter permease [Terriglobales bacterium]
MNLVARFRSWLKWIVKGRKLEAEMEAEVGFHIESYAADLMRKGLSQQEALRQARIEFGGIESLKDAMRASVGVRWWAELGSDLRYGARMLGKSPGFTAVAVCSLALGIGANTAIFSTTKTILLDSLSVPHPEQLRVLRWEFPGDQPMHSLSGDVEQTKAGATTSSSFSYPVYEALSQHGETFESLAAFENDIPEVVASVDGYPESVSVQLVSGDFFSTFQVTVAQGRALLPSDDVVAGGGSVAVISDAYWEWRFARSPAAIGKTIEVNHIPITVVGVAPPSFTGPRPGRGPEMFMPLSMQPIVDPSAYEGTSGKHEDGEVWWLAVVGRLKPHATDTQALASLEGGFAQVVKTTLTSKGHKDVERLRLMIEPGNRGLEKLRNELSETMRVLLVVVGLVLLLACANLANLLLARSASRKREWSVRLAIGAQRSRIMRQALTESMILALLGGAAGLVLGYLGRNLVPRVLHQTAPVHFDWRVMAFTSAISLVAGLLFGGFPAWQATRTDVNSGLKDTGHTTTGGRSKALVGRSLVVVQVCISMVLLTGAGLFLRTLHNLMHSDRGFQSEHLLLFDLGLPETQYKTAASRAAMFRQLQAQIGAIPGVKTVTFSGHALLAGSSSTTNFDPDGQKVPQHKHAWRNIVGTKFFETVGIPIMAGRGFSDEDSESSPKVAVINLRLARALFPDENPIGKTFNYEHIRIVGICGDAKFRDLRMDPPPTYYTLYQQFATGNSATFEAKAVVDPASLTGAIREAVRSLDRELPITNVRTQDEQIDGTLRRERLFATLTSGFGVLALLLASIGIYGIMAYTVSGRTNEIGIRIALGAQTGQVLRTVLREAWWLALAGVGVGLIVALAMSRLIQSMLYGLRPTDPITSATAATLLVAIALAASWIPARKAARIDPINALRHE